MFMLYIAHLTEANKFHVTFHDFRLQIIIIIIILLYVTVSMPYVKYCY